MRFSPQSEEEIDKEREERMKLLKPGRGQFTVLNGEQKEKDGSEYLMLVCQVWDSENHSRQIKNVYLGPKMMWQLRHFCYAVGLVEQYEMGGVELEDVVNKSGECEIEIEKGDVNPKGGRFPDKNRIKDFIVPENVRQTSNYQASKQQQVNGGASPGGQNKSPAAGQPQEPSPTELAKRRAWTKFKEKTAGMELKGQQAAFRDHVTDYFGAKPVESISPNQWDKFIADGFLKPTVASPVGDEPVFKDEDIPF